MLRAILPGDLTVTTLHRVALRLVAFLWGTMLFLPLSSSHAGIGTCSTDEIREMRDDGFSIAEIRELCREETSQAPSKARPKQYNRGEETFERSPRQAYGRTCGCYAGFYCPLVSPLPQGSPCFCVTAYGNCQGQAY